MTRIYKEYLREIAETGGLRKGRVQMFYQHIAPRMADYIPGGRKCALTDEECARIIAICDEMGGFAITAEHDAQGRQWLQRYAKRYGLPVEAGDPANIERFTFQGAHMEYGGTYYRGDWCQSAPVYRIHFTNGSSLDYWMVGNWREGGVTVEWNWVTTKERAA